MRQGRQWPVHLPSHLPASLVLVSSRRDKPRVLFHQNNQKGVMRRAQSGGGGGSKQAGGPGWTGTAGQTTSSWNFVLLGPEPSILSFLYPFLQPSRSLVPVGWGRWLVCASLKSAFPRPSPKCRFGELVLGWKQMAAGILGDTCR